MGDTEMSGIIPERKVARISDEGYSSDISPTKIEVDEKVTKDLIKKESEEFKTKYFVKKILYNSANGVIYDGKWCNIYVYLEYCRCFLNICLNFEILNLSKVLIYSKVSKSTQIFSPKFVILDFCTKHEILIHNFKLLF